MTPRAENYVNAAVADAILTTRVGAALRKACSDYIGVVPTGEPDAQRQYVKNCCRNVMLSLAPLDIENVIVSKIVEEIMSQC